MGPQICWIDKQSFLLSRIELPSEELRKRIYPNHEFTSFSWRFDFFDATIEARMPSKVFRLENDNLQPRQELVTAFQHQPDDQDPDEADESSNGELSSEATAPSDPPAEGE